MKILVTPDSATRGQHTWGKTIDTIFPINEDHSGMVKFSEDDPSLKVVVEKLKRMLSSQQSVLHTHTSHLSADVMPSGVYPQASLSANKKSNYNGKAPMWSLG